QLAVGVNRLLIVREARGCVGAEELVGQRGDGCCRVASALQNVSRVVEPRAKLAVLREVREELLSNLRRDEVVFGEEFAVLVPTAVRRVELQEPLDESEVLRESLVRQLVEAEVQV